MLGTHWNGAVYEGSLACHTYCEARHPFITAIVEDQWHLHLLSNVLWRWYYAAHLWKPFNFDIAIKGIITLLLNVLNSYCSLWKVSRTCIIYTVKCISTTTNKKSYLRIHEPRSTFKCMNTVFHDLLSVCPYTIAIFKPQQCTFMNENERLSLFENVYVLNIESSPVIKQMTHLTSVYL